VLFTSTGRNERRLLKAPELLKNRGYRGGFFMPPAKKVSKYPQPRKEPENAFFEEPSGSPPGLPSGGRMAAG
jgi:hypothetical protein